MHTSPDPATGAGISFLKLKAVCERTSLGKTTLYALVKAGQFPAPQHIAGTRNVVWPSHRVDEFIARQLASSASDMTEA